MDNRFLSAALGVAMLGTPVHADPNSVSANFAVMRNGSQIGTNRIKVGREGSETTIQTVTHVAVGFGTLTLYRYDQTETEQWADGRFVAMNATTDDNGSEHRASANARDGKIIIHGDNDKVSEAPPTAVPFNLWNADLVARELAFDTKDGSMQPLKVIDRGEERLVVQGQVRATHHYQIVTGYTQDVWYDENRQLVQVELKGSDGSTIRYQLM